MASLSGTEGTITGCQVRVVTEGGGHYKMSLCCLGWTASRAVDDGV